MSPSVEHDQLADEASRTKLQLTDGNMVVVVDTDEVAKLQVAGKRSRLAGNAFHSTTIAKEEERVVVDQVEARLVEHTTSMCLCHGKADCIGKALT